MTKDIRGHITALFTVFVWGTTFTVTKILLKYFSPYQILFIRFFIAFLLLTVIDHKRIKYICFKDELLFIFAALTGVVFYFLFENTALVYTTAANVGILVAVSPFITALLSRLFLKEELKKCFFIGFIVSMIGITVITFNGKFVLELNPKGDTLALLAAIVWAAYSTASKKLTLKGYPALGATKHTFMYALLIMIPVILFSKNKIPFDYITEKNVLLSFLFLGCIGSGICYVTWNGAIKILGATKTSSYIYLSPVIATVFSFIVLNEKITYLEICGIILIIIGLVISDGKFIRLKQTTNIENKI
ncbi:MAG: DMT family transporter [Clostridia bacterium]|jgi:drug/metabolite transporter (DMT)-like permease|nr:DMT family transporter [Clostridia bacterium]